jgi:hypothetical protein
VPGDRKFESISLQGRVVCEPACWRSWTRRRRVRSILVGYWCAWRHRLGRRNGEREEGLVEVGGDHWFASRFGLRCHCPRPGGRRGLSTCRETGGLIRPRLRGLSRRTPDTGNGTPVSGLNFAPT